MLLQNLKQAFIKEFFIYMAMLMLLTVLMHSDILSSPFTRFEMMSEKENYSHPLLYTGVIYSIFFIIRKLLDLIIGLFEKK
jgi:hypothetical protein